MKSAGPATKSANPHRVWWPAGLPAPHPPPTLPKAQFTQDAEHLAIQARKLWNTLWSMGVFTHLAMCLCVLCERAQKDRSVVQNKFPEIRKTLESGKMPNLEFLTSREIWVMTNQTT